MYISFWLSKLNNKMISAKVLYYEILELTLSLKNGLLPQFSWILKFCTRENSKSRRIVAEDHFLWIKSALDSIFLNSGLLPTYPCSLNIGAFKNSRRVYNSHYFTIPFPKLRSEDMRHFGPSENKCMYR